MPVLGTGLERGARVGHLSQETPSVICVAHVKSLYWCWLPTKNKPMRKGCCALQVIIWSRQRQRARDAKWAISSRSQCEAEFHLMYRSLLFCIIVALHLLPLVLLSSAASLSGAMDMYYGMPLSHGICLVLVRMAREKSAFNFSLPKFAWSVVLSDSLTRLRSFWLLNRAHTI